MADNPPTLDDVINGSVDDLVAYFRSPHPDAPFTERIKKFEEFHNPRVGLAISQHADYIARGKPTERGKLPGAYDIAYKRLDEIVKSNTDKLSKEHAEQVLEAYVDAFLRAVHPEFEQAIQSAKKEGLDEQAIRNFKGSLFGRYHTDERGLSLNPLSESYLKRVEGRTKLEVVEELRGLAQQSSAMYSEYLSQQATAHLIKDLDRIQFAPYFAEKLKQAGFEHPDHPLTKSTDALQQDYSALLQGKIVARQGYKPLQQSSETRAEG